MIERPIEVAVLGAGTRGALFGEILADHPHLARVVAVAEPREPYRRAFAERHGLAPEMVYQTWQELTARPRLCDAVVIATMDRDHYGPAIACIEQGYDVLLEKPIAPDLEECRDIARAQARTGRVVAVCHSLRHQRGFAAVARLVAEGRLGELTTIDLIEQVGFEHFAHSYIRGNWGNAGRATPLLLAKSCHDLDYIAWLVGKPCLRVASFGSLGHFTAANAPPGATERCSDGCPSEAECAYSAIKQYVQQDREAWPAAVVSPTHGQAEHMAAIASGPYGRCVYRADNDVVDRQVVAMEFAGGVTATFTVTAFTQGGGRRLRLNGTRADLTFDETTITIRDFAGHDVETIRPGRERGPHGGGDHRVVRNWLEAVRHGNPELVTNDVHAALRTHAIGFAAERARVLGRLVDLAELAADQPDAARGTSA